MFPENSIRVKRASAVVGTDSMGNDILGETYEIVEGVILAPDSTSEQPYPHQDLDQVIVELHLPTSYTARIGGTSFEALDGPFAGRFFKVLGDSVPYAWTPLKWNRRVRAVEVY